MVQVLIFYRFQCRSLHQKGLVRCESTVYVPQEGNRQDSCQQDSGTYRRNYNLTCVFN